LLPINKSPFNFAVILITDVVEGEAERLDLGELLDHVEAGHDVAEKLERLVEAVHSAALAGIGLDAAQLELGDARRRHLLLFGAPLLGHFDLFVVGELVAKLSGPLGLFALLLLLRLVQYHLMLLLLVMLVL